MARIILLAATLLLVIVNTEAQGNSATQVIIFGVEPVSRLEVSPDPGPLPVCRPEDAPVAIRDAGTRYSLLSNIDQLKISASIGAPLPEGIRLRVRVECAHGLSRGDVDISRPGVPADLVTGIRRGVTSGHWTVYLFSTDKAIRELPVRSRVIFFTVTN